MTMFLLSPRGLIFVWLLLIAMTGLTMVNAGLFGEGGGLSIGALAILFGLSVLKAEAVLRFYLRLQRSNGDWRAGFTAFFVVLALLLLGLFSIPV